MVSLVADSLLGKGLYTPAEAAMYARVSTAMLNRWLYGDARNQPVFEPEHASSPERLVTFPEFVQTLAIRTIRLKHQVPLQKIREALVRASNDYSIRYPFAMEHATFLLGEDIYIKRPGDEDLTQLTGRHRHQMRMMRIVEMYLEDLTFGEDGLARQYRAFGWPGREIVMHPAHRFGEPIVLSCGYTAQALWEACETEGSFEAAARAYGVSVEEVRLAYTYYESLCHVEAVAA